LDAAEAMVRRAGGRLEWLTADERQQIHFVFPAAAAPPAAAAVSGSRPAAAAARVLVIDDDAGNREGLAELLRREGFAVDAAATWEEVGALAERAPPQAALVDLAMPDVNGWELARRLRARWPEVRVALVTGWEPSDAEVRRHGGLVDQILHKPIDLARLRQFLGRGSDAPG
jgi:CheY-like chemotaxis protein